MDKTQYLPEDHDLLDELESIGPLSTGVPLEEQKRKIHVVQIKALLRSRKATHDIDQSNTKYSNVILAFAFVQLIMAIIQFTFSVLTAEKYSFEQWFGIFALFTCVASMYYIFNHVGKINKE